MSERCDLAIVGAGAAGLATAIFAAEAAQAAGRAVSVIALDGAARLGAKILISGGGRCNVTHAVVTAADYNGAQNIVRTILAAFDAPAAVRWFTALGVALKREETGKLFPVTDSARTVLDALLRRCAALGVDLRPGHRVNAVRPLGDAGFAVEHERGMLIAKRVALATGGRSLPRTGSDGGGWEIARRLGHSVSATYPALVPLLLDESMFHAGLSGLSHQAELSTLVAGRLADRRSGSLLWTHFGVSGPLTLDTSRHWLTARAAADAATAVELRCGFLPGRDFTAVERWLIARAAARPRATLTTVLAEELPARLAAALIAHSGADPASAIAQLTRERRRALTHALTALPLPVRGARGWNYAEATAGGVPLDEIDRRTLQSRRLPGLYLTGEMLDCDGRIGGFNFQWAWATGFLAGRHAGKEAAGCAAPE